jgi:hypothetical protein
LQCAAPQWSLNRDQPCMKLCSCYGFCSSAFIHVHHHQLKLLRDLDWSHRHHHKLKLLWELDWRRTSMFCPRFWCFDFRLSVTM